MKTNYIMYSVQDYSVLYNNAIHQIYIVDELVFYAQVESTGITRKGGLGT